MRIVFFFAEKTSCRYIHKEIKRRIGGEYLIKIDMLKTEQIPRLIKYCINYGFNKNEVLMDVIFAAHHNLVHVFYEEEEIMGFYSFLPVTTETLKMILTGQFNELEVYRNIIKNDSNKEVLLYFVLSLINDENVRTAAYVPLCNSLKSNVIEMSKENINVKNVLASYDKTKNEIILQKLGFHKPNSKLGLYKTSVLDIFFAD